jgi:murein DD-endopeptidase MepM/ murein hydrolase activator NlpD
MNWSQSQRVKTLLLALAFLATFGIFLTWLSRRQGHQNVPTLRPKTQDQSPKTKDQRPNNSTAQSSSTPIVQPSGLIIPVAGVTSEQLVDTFSAARGEGRVHDAIDIPAPQGTPVLAAANGKILKLFQSERGGTTIYQLSGDEKFIYYYAHLDRYADGLHEGQIVRQGETIAYVGDTGNAGPGNYHLHFSIAMTSDPKRWSEGVPINPYPLLRR